MLFENMIGKGENAGNQDFLLFPQCFLPIKKQISIFSVMFILLYANAFNFDLSKMLSFGKELILVSWNYAEWVGPWTVPKLRPTPGNQTQLPMITRPMLYLMTTDITQYLQMNLGSFIVYIVEKGENDRYLYPSFFNNVF